ncbi:MAG: O-antigen ligase family protein [Synechococcales bacterium]|nr:O-antigen ligase family protein [Synechococcales bacterium]
MKKLALSDRFLHFHSWVLMGYVLMGRGFTYVGVPPLFIGEISLLFGLLTCLFNRASQTFWTQAFPKLFQLLPTKLLITFQVWCLICTIPHFPRYGMDTIRDAAIWYYGLFGLIVALLITAKPDRIFLLLNNYRRFALGFLFLGFIMFAISQARISPLMPGGRAFIVEMKEADTMAHLAGAVGFAIAMKLRPMATMVPLLLLNLALIIPRGNRSGTIAFLCAFGIVMLFRLRSQRIWQIITIIAVALTFILLLYPDLVDPVIAKMSTVFSDSGAERYQGTKEFRIRWWSYIIDYTFGGDYFWMGKGFGVNLGVDDGFDPLGDGLVRSPHNGHICILARSGVPGFLLWVSLQVSWFSGILARTLKAYKIPGQGAWRGLFITLLAHWTAFMATTSFEVVIEGPSGGIWIWTLIGLGLAAMALYDEHPDLLTTPSREGIEPPDSPG